MLEDNSRRKKVLCPIEGKNGKTYWRTMGTAFVNKDNSINVYLDVLPTNAKLHVRDWDDKDDAAPRRSDGSAQIHMRAVPGGGGGGGVAGVAYDAGVTDELPF